MSLSPYLSKDALLRWNKGKSKKIPGQSHCRSCLHRCTVTAECVELPMAPSLEASWYGPETKQSKSGLSVFGMRQFYPNRKDGETKQLLKALCNWLTVGLLTITHLCHYPKNLQNQQLPKLIFKRLHSDFCSCFVLNVHKKEKQERGRERNRTANTQLTCI